MLMRMLAKSPFSCTPDPAHWFLCRTGAQRSLLMLPLILALLAGCTQSSSSQPAATQRPAPSPTTTLQSGTVRLQVTEVARKLDTVWALAWDSDGRLWYTERPGQLTRLGDQPQQIAGVVENGEGGLMGLEINRQHRIFLMYTASNG